MPVALRSVLTLTSLRAVRPETVHSAVDVTSGSGLPRRAEASSAHGIARRLVLAVARLQAAVTEAALFTHSVAAGSMEPRRADADARRGVAGGAAHTVTLQLTQGAVQTGGAH